MRRVPLLQKLKSLHPEREEKELFSLILRGGVFVNGEKVAKPGVPIDPDAALVVREGRAFVSRGGEKLSGALDAWGVTCEGAAWIDAGCSTGGFTDCLLQRGASLVYAVNVGVGQLDWRLRGDPRVRVREGTNIMTVNRADLDPVPGAQLPTSRSGRSWARRVTSWGSFLSNGGSSSPNRSSRCGIPDRIFMVSSTMPRCGPSLPGLMTNLAAEGVQTRKAFRSPIPGRKGNHEFLLLLRAGDGRR